MSQTHWWIWCKSTANLSQTTTHYLLPRWLSLKKKRVCSATRGGSTCEGQACCRVWQRPHPIGRGSVWCPIAPQLHPVTHSCQSVYQYGTAGIFSCCYDYIYPIVWYCSDSMYPIFDTAVTTCTLFSLQWLHVHYFHTAVTTGILFSYCWLHVHYFHTAVTTCTLFSYCCDYMYTISIQLWPSVRLYTKSILLQLPEYYFYTAVTKCILFSHLYDYLYPVFIMMQLPVYIFYTSGVITSILFSHCRDYICILLLYWCDYLILFLYWCDYLYTIFVMLWLHVY